MSCRLLSLALSTGFVFGCAPALPEPNLPLALQCRAGAPESPLSALLPAAASEPHSAGQMSEQAALAKRLFDGEKWAEAVDAMRVVASGATGDDLGNREIAEYHLAIALYRMGNHRDALAQFLLISRDRSHLKWSETLLWHARLLEDDETAEGALRGISAYDYDQVERFNNPQQRELFWRLQQAAGRVAYRRGAYDVAIGFFSNVDSRAGVVYKAAQECATMARSRQPQSLSPAAATQEPAIAREGAPPADRAALRAKGPSWSSVDSVHSGSQGVAPPADPPAPAPDAKAVIASLQGSFPRRFGDHIRGIKRGFRPRGDELALTLDLCDGVGAGAIDEEMFAFLRREKIPASVFVSGRFAQNHAEFVTRLAEEPQFSIENHGFRHRPCTADGRAIFGIAGTRGIESMVDEIEENARLIAQLTGRRPLLYRSGTAHMDDVCVRAANQLGETPLGFTVSGDVGASLRRASVKQALLGARAGAIIVLHAHRPRSESFEGFRDALPFLRERGAHFVSLSGAQLTE
jgi:peptidoglycan/xylan/chitin deacetylase (PgdA/CDA1 family)